MEPDETPTTEFEFITHEPVEPSSDETPYVYDESAKENTLKGNELLGIYLLIKAVRRGNFGVGDDRLNNLVPFVGENAAIALIYAADNKL